MDPFTGAINSLRLEIHQLKDAVAEIKSLITANSGSGAGGAPRTAAKKSGRLAVNRAFEMLFILYNTKINELDDDAKAIYQQFCQMKAQDLAQNIAVIDKQKASGGAISKNSESYWRAVAGAFWRNFNETEKNIFRAFNERTMLPAFFSVEAGSSPNGQVDTVVSPSPAVNSFAPQTGAFDASALLHAQLANMAVKAAGQTQ
jgi:hypothetical protein